MKNLLMLCIATALSVSCAKKDEASPTTSGDKKNNTVPGAPNKAEVPTRTPKRAKIEFEFGGDYQDYDLRFTIGFHREGNNYSDIIIPKIIEPQGAKWTDKGALGIHTYNGELATNKFIVESAEPADLAQFILLCTQTVDFTLNPITATIKVYADEKEVKKYEYKHVSGKTAEPLMETVHVNTY